jgi:hypothetical protein
MPARYVNLYRCSDGHYFVASRGKIVWASVHLLTSVYLRCPVDHRWRVARWVPRAGLTDEQVAEALRHPF